jgi:peptide/nickel transport system substrate-binding protein
MVWDYSMGVPATYQDFLAAGPDVSLVAVPATNAPAVLAFNNARGPFADENLRKAVSYALDYDVFKAYFGSEYASVPNRGFVPPTTVGYKDTEKLSHDIKKANDFMAAAGYEKNAAGLYVDAKGKPMSFALTVNSTKQTHLGYAELIKTQLEAFGMQVAIDALDGASYNAKTSNKFSNNNITTEAAIYGYTSAGMGMMNGLASIYVDGTHAVQGGCQVFDPGFQAVIAQLASSRNLEEYYVAAGALQDFYAVHTPLIALYWDNLMYAYSSKLSNLTVDAVFGLNNVNNWMTISSK